MIFSTCRKFESR